MKKLVVLAIAAAFATSGTMALAQNGGSSTPAEAPNPFAPVPLGAGPWDLQAAAEPIRVEVFTSQLERPWGLAFLPDGRMLVTERPGRLRLVERDGSLDPTPVAGLPPIYNLGIAGLKDIALHPDFENNRLIYLSFSKPDPDDRMNSTLALIRARWDGGHELTAVEEIFEADAWYGTMPLPPKCCGQGPAFGSYGGRMAFGADGTIFLASGDRNYGEMVQDPSNHFGKILRLNDDGSVPADNPFVGQEGWKPEIWSTGHRNPLGLTFHPLTGELWESEMGPSGGDEINRIERGANYGWMDVTQGQHYDRAPAKGIRNVPGMTDPVLSYGPPSVNPGGIAFYDGDLFPQWHGDLFVARMDKTLLRVSFDEAGNPAEEEELLKELQQRMRDVISGPDGNLYILTDETEGVILRVTPGG